MTLWLWYDPSNVSQYFRRLYDMDEPIRNVCIYYLAGSSFRTLLIWYVTWYELTSQNAVFPFLCPYMVFRVLVSQNPHYHTTFKYQRRTSTGSWLFALLSRDFEQVFGQIVSIRIKTLGNTNMVALRLSKREKGALPVDRCFAQKRHCLSSLSSRLNALGVAWIFFQKLSLVNTPAVCLW